MALEAQRREVFRQFKSDPLVGDVMRLDWN